MSAHSKKVAVLLIGIAGTWLLLAWFVSALVEFSVSFNHEIYQEGR